jgi:hypothetical protein
MSYLFTLEDNEVLDDVRALGESVVGGIEKLNKLAELIDKANSECCGCGWPGHIADRLEHAQEA